MLGFVSRTTRLLFRIYLAVSCPPQCAFSLLGSAAMCSVAYAQVFTVDSSKIESRYTDIKRTHVALNSQPLLQRTKLQLVRVLEAEQGFAMRPLPKGSRGMTLVANGGAASPNGADYVKTLEHNGVALQAADRVMITDIKFLGDKIVFELNYMVSDEKHRILRHISIGANGAMIPLAQDSGQEPTGVRITLQFEKFVPEMTGTEVYGVTDTACRFQTRDAGRSLCRHAATAIERGDPQAPCAGRNESRDGHGCDGQAPDSKSREREGDMPFEEVAITASRPRTSNSFASTAIAGDPCRRLQDGRAAHHPRPG